jgi:hypothetical protein
MDHGLLVVVVAILAWLIPGAGHVFIKEKKRGIIIFATITLTFLAGLYIGSIGVIDPVNSKPWYFGQMLTSPMVAIVGSVVANARAEDSSSYRVYARPHDYGQIYTSVAGGLNLLCILNAMYMAHSGRGELIGEDDDDV